jgi:hypothetical protein
MAKSIRSKVMKRARSIMRSTVGAAQAAKATRQALRRLATAVGPQATGITVPAGPPRTRPQRFTFNPGARALRVAAELEDLTDDEADVRLGRIAAIAAATRAAAGGLLDEEEEAAAAAAEAAEAAAAAAEAEAGGVRWAPGRTQPKHGGSLGSGGFRPEDAAGPAVGFYESELQQLAGGRRRRSKGGRGKGKR